MQEGAHRGMLDWTGRDILGFPTAPHFTLLSAKSTLPPQDVLLNTLYIFLFQSDMFIYIASIHSIS